VKIIQSIQSQTNELNKLLTSAEGRSALVRVIAAVVNTVAQQIRRNAEIFLGAAEISTEGFSFIFEGGDDQMEPVGVGAPCVGDVLQRHEVGPRENVTDALVGVSTR